jgi:hypothetical protein
VNRPPVDRAGAVDADGAPTAPCKTPDRSGRFAHEPLAIIMAPRAADVVPNTYGEKGGERSWRNGSFGNPRFER